MDTAQKAFKTHLKRILTFTASLLIASCGCPERIHPDLEPHPLPTFCVPTPIRVALVLGSGGIRGMAHVGVIEELEAAGIPIDLIVGCSAGSIVGALYADNPTSAHIKKAVCQLKTNTLLDIDLWQCRFGLSQTKQMYAVLDKHLTAERFDQLKIPLVIVASDLHSAELVILGSGDLVKAVQASCSIPFVFVPCKHLGRVLVDGGVINPVPVQVARDLGAQLIIAVDLAELLPQTFPTNLFQVATRSAEIAFLWQNDVCTREAEVIIRPKTSNCGAFNDQQRWQIYAAGREAARKQIPRIHKLLSELPICEKQAPKEVVPRCYGPGIYR